MIDKIKALINENEKVIGVARIHWIVFIPPAFYSFLALTVGLFFHPLVGAIIFAMALYPIYNSFIYFFMTYLALTNEKVLSRKGFLTRDWTRMEFDRIENAYLEEPIIGRVLGYATVVVSGVGSGRISVAHVQNGDLFVRALEKQLSDNKKK